MHDTYPYMDKESQLIPQGVIDFFKRQPHLGIYILPNPKISSHEEISYRSLIGKNAPPPPKKKQSGNSIEYPFENQDKKSSRQSEAVAKYIVRQMNPDIETRVISNIRKSYMLNGGTRPVQVRFNKEGNGCKKPVYVKQIDSKRLFGLFVYNLINGMNQTEFGFNEGMIVEKEIAGTLLPYVDESALLFMPEYREGLVRASVHMDFLSSSDTRRDNRMIGESYKTILLDFDDLFLPIDKTRNALFRSYQGVLRLSENEVEMIIDEQNNVYNRIVENQDLFFDFLDVAKKLLIISSFEQRDGTLKVYEESLDERIQKISGSRNLEDHYITKLESYRSNFEMLS